MDGIQILRLPMIPRPNGGFLDRLVDQGSFAASAVVAVGDARWADVVLVESPPLFLGLTAAFHSVFSRRPYVFHVADPWPDFPIAMGALNNHLVRRIAFAIEHVAYRRAALITTVTPGLVRLLDSKSSARGRVRLLPNAADVGRFNPDVDPASARRRLGWPESKLTLAYVGSVGQAQGLRTLIDAVAPMKEDGLSVHVIGEGFERDRLAAVIGTRGLEHVHFDPPVPIDQVPSILAAADAVLVMLRRGSLYDESLPTKLVEGLAAGRPLIVSAGGEAARLVEKSGAGYVAAAEDAGALREAIRVCLADPNRRARGLAGRKLAEAEFDRPAIVARLAGYLEEVASAASRHQRLRSRGPKGGA